MRLLCKGFKERKGISTILAAVLMVVVVVVASLMVLAWSTGLLGGLFVSPTVSKEALTVESSVFNSGTNLTLSIRNMGTGPVSLQTYYVKDSSGNIYTLGSWAGPVINPSAVNPANFLIGQSCNGCFLGGSAFMFAKGSSYTVEVVTTRDSQFNFYVAW